MVLLETETFRAERLGRHLQVALKTSHSVFSTCPVNGGWRDDLSFLVNHQSSEGRGGEIWERLHPHPHEAEYHREVCGELKLPPEQTVLLNTAANMQYASLAIESDGTFSVAAFVTAGVRGNAARAGDPATWYEDEAGQLSPVTDKSGAVPNGTIHALILYNRPLRPAALARCVATMAEAKAAVLQELAVPSLYGQGLATGTGTDGFALAAPEIEGVAALRYAGAHFKLGELTGQVVMKALREALHWQNGMDAAITRNFFHALSRFGIREASLMESVSKTMAGDALELLSRNREALWHEPQIAAAAYGLAAVLDRAAWGTLPPSSRDESVLHQLALVACAIAHDPNRFPEFRSALSAQWKGVEHLELSLAGALVLGWRAKWNMHA